MGSRGIQDIAEAYSSILRHEWCAAKTTLDDIFSTDKSMKEKMELLCSMMIVKFIIPLKYSFMENVMVGSLIEKKIILIFII